MLFAYPAHQVRAKWFVELKGYFSSLFIGFIVSTCRTFDIQCKTQEDYEKLLGALRAVCPPA